MRYPDVMQRPLWISSEAPGRIKRAQGVASIATGGSRAYRSHAPSRAE